VNGDGSVNAYAAVDDGRITMLNASFGRELAEVHFKEALQQAEHRRLVGCLKRDRRAAAAARHKQRKQAAAQCPQDLG
jgi:hypothetical protein